MNVWDQKTIERCEQWASEMLLPTMLERDRQPTFNEKLWREANDLGFQSVWFSTQTEVEKMRQFASMILGIARGSGDVPFCSSLGAHSVIGFDLFLRFANARQIETYLPSLRDPSAMIAICNSESGAGTDLRKLKSVATLVDQNQALVTMSKPFSTNASAASLVFASAWVREPERKDRLEVFILEPKDFTATSLETNLAGFRTGFIGGIEVKDRQLNVQDRVLHAKHGGLSVFKRCFDTERLFIGIATLGLLERIEREAKDMLMTREAGGAKILEKQYVQMKVVNIHALKVQMRALIEKILSDDHFQLSNYSSELAVLKLMACEKAPEAVIEYFSLIGSSGYFDDHACQKMIRDVMGLKYFGGTAELQRNALMEDLFRAEAKAPVPLQTKQAS